MSEGRIIDGRLIAAAIEDETRRLIGKATRKPRLTVLIAAQSSETDSYAMQLRRTASRCGVEIDFAGTAHADKRKMEELVKSAVSGPSDGILIAQPLPENMAIEDLAEYIPPEKDVDCSSAVSRGYLFSGGPVFTPATAQAVMEIIKYHRIETSGRHVVIVGRSAIVGKPLAMLLLSRGYPGDATVTVCHSRSRDLNRYTRSADILISAAGRAELIDVQDIKKGAVVIDVSINVVESEGARRIIGDVVFSRVREVASMITPVPGGVGPVTSAVIMRNTATSMVQSGR